MPNAAALHGGTNIVARHDPFAIHQGNVILLLAVLLVYNGGLWIAIYEIYAGLPFGLPWQFSAAALPLLALTSVGGFPKPPLLVANAWLPLT